MKKTLFVFVLLAGFNALAIPQGECPSAFTATLRETTSTVPSERMFQNKSVAVTEQAFSHGYSVFPEYITRYTGLSVYFEFLRQKENGVCKYTAMDVIDADGDIYNWKAAEEGAIKVAVKVYDSKFRKESFFAHLRGNSEQATLTIEVPDFAANQYLSLFEEMGFKFNNALNTKSTDPQSATGYSYRGEHDMLGIYEKTGTHKFQVIFE